ncbi:hypothetical protein [Dendronalium sp. ChiSLP03b]|uniref:hypothetical protein n=1 Tax=Dendronalium sp. ChiSLP03b TaxID=3075381 RepID=UPI002AD3DBE4|nr:hypothetical protein [Dendronalium sp. ChiSLP03b]MDZ8205777.1 hypothetical protein [Dendronalium sp. ChiSLP03b]
MESSSLKHDPAYGGLGVETRLIASPRPRVPLLSLLAGLKSYSVKLMRMPKQLLLKPEGVDNDRG